MTILTRLLVAFRPSEWSEVTYTSGPPFVVDNSSGRVFLVARDHGVEVSLDGASVRLGLKRMEGDPEYLISRADSVKTFREFDWLVRRSWRNRDLAVIWALVYLGEKRKWTQSDLSLKALANLAGLDTKECSAALKRLFRARVGSDTARALSEIAADRRLVELTLEKVLANLPTWTEEVVMSVLCSVDGGSVADIYESLLGQGFSVGAVYKVVERLKRREYIYPERHFRVNERGPMREMLSADCRNCFYGFTDPDMCLQDTLRQLEGVMQRDYNKTSTREERAVLYKSLKAVPYGSRINRRVLASLRLMREIERMKKEGRVSSLLKKIEEHYHVELPVKTPAESSR